MALKGNEADISNAISPSATLDISGQIVREADLSITRMPSPGSALRLVAVGRLDASSAGHAWRTLMPLVQRERPASLVIDATDLAYCDGAGAALLLHMKNLQAARRAAFEVVGASTALENLLALYDCDSKHPHQKTPEPVPPFIERIGRMTRVGLGHTAELLEFYGRLTIAILSVLRSPRKLRWGDALATAASAGVDALPIISILGFLIGLIMAFQSAIPLRKFGADLFVANMVGLSVTRELGPLMTAVILAGRSGSAFAAELGTMRVNEEIDALTTMALDPVRFLVVPRVLAAVAMMPFLTAFMDLCSLIGGGVVMAGFGFPPITYITQLTRAVHLNDFTGGLLKAIVFGGLIAGVGCARGLTTRGGASGVGTSTTSAVVSGIVLIVVADGIFSVAFFYLGY